MSRGPTRRVDRLLEAGRVSHEVLVLAGREADLLEHPYIGMEHIELARLRLAGWTAERQALRDQLASGVPRRWWRPLGRHSALRPAGLEHTRAARRAAEQAAREERRGD